MKIEYDTTVNAMYIRLNENEITTSQEVANGVALDFDVAGELVGIELLYVRQRITLPTEILYEYLPQSEQNTGGD